MLVGLLIASSCITLNGQVYCPQNGQTTPVQEPTLLESDTQQVDIIRGDGPVPEAVLNSDARYGQVYFTYKSSLGQTRCAESILYTLENRTQPASNKSTCGTLMKGIFGADFTSGSKPAEMVFRLMAQYSYMVNKTEFRLPLGLDRRMQQHTGLSTFTE